MSDEKGGGWNFLGYLFWGTVVGVFTLAAFESYGGQAFFLGFLAGCFVYGLVSNKPPAT